MVSPHETSLKIMKLYGHRWAMVPFSICSCFLFENSWIFYGPPVLGRHDRPLEERFATRRKMWIGMWIQPTNIDSCNQHFSQSKHGFYHHLTWIPSAKMDVMVHLCSISKWETHNRFLAAFLRANTDWNHCMNRPCGLAYGCFDSSY